MPTTEKTESSPSGDFFRIPVQPECNESTIRIGRTTAKATVQETSIDGFTVLIGKAEASKLRLGQAWVLEYDGTRLEVHAEWFFNAPDGKVQVGLRRLRDLTPVPKIGIPFWSRFAISKTASGTSAAGYGGFLLVLFCSMSLPGLGDQLGTSTRIQGAVRWLFVEARHMLFQ